MMRNRLGVGCEDPTPAGHSQGVEVVQAVAEERFRTLYEAYYLAVFRYARRRISADLAADAASEVFLVAWRHLPEVPPDPLPWLYAVARRVVANQRRGAARFGRLPDRVFANAATTSAHKVAGVEETVTSSMAFAAAFNRLSDDDREVLGLVAWEGLGARDAAMVLGCSVTAVTMRLHRARRRLRAALESIAEEN
jgi:RNA polymerase sigma-70 factor, ECF subfamily